MSDVAIAAPPGLRGYMWSDDQIAALKPGVTVSHWVPGHPCEGNAMDAMVDVEVLEAPTPVRVVGMGDRTYHHIVVRWPVFQRRKVRTYVEHLVPGTIKQAGNEP